MTAAITALAVASALVQASYPAAFDRDAIAAWLPRATGLAADQAVAVTASAVIAIVSRAEAPDGHARLLLRALPLTPEATARTGALAWEMRLEIYCQARAVRLGATTGYASRAATGEGLALAPAEADWRSPQPGTPLDSAWRAACEPGFQSPLVAPRRQVAATAGPPAPVARSAPTFVRDAAARAPVQTPAQTTAQTTASPTPPKPGRGAVQVVSSPNAADTRQALENLQGRLAAAQGLRTRIEPAQVRGRTVYRGVVAGFGSREQAQAFCAALKRAGQDCLAR